MNTKFSKTFTTFFFPVGDHIQQIVYDWVRYLKEDLLWGNDDPLFPKTNVITGEDRIFKTSGFKKEHWNTASPIRTIFRDAFEAADLPYFNPHSFRNTIVTLGQKLCQSPEEFKAWSQNLGHEDVLTTLYSYGHVQQHLQGEIFQQLTPPVLLLTKMLMRLQGRLLKQWANKTHELLIHNSDNLLKCTHMSTRKHYFPFSTKL